MKLFILVAALFAASPPKPLLLKSQINLADDCRTRPKILGGFYEISLSIEAPEPVVATQTSYEKSIGELEKEYPEEPPYQYRFCKITAEFPGPQVTLTVKLENKVVAEEKVRLKLFASRAVQRSIDEECPKTLDLSINDDEGDFWINVEKMPYAVHKIAKNRELSFYPHSPNWMQGTVKKTPKGEYQLNWELSTPNPPKLSTWKEIQFQHVDPTAEKDDYSLYCSGKVDLN